MNGPIHKLLRPLSAAVLAVGIMSLAGGAYGDPNTVPYSEGFDDIANGYAITNIAGWSGYEFDSSTVVTNDFEFTTVTRPMSPAGENKVLQLNTEGGVLTNAFSMTDGLYPKLYLDTMVNFVAHDENPAGLFGDGETKLAVFLNFESNIVVFHGGADGDTDSFTVLTNVVESLPVPTIPGEWYRLTVEMDMVTANIEDPAPPFDTIYYPFFRVKLNGENLSHVSEGFEVPSADTGDYNGGAWFRFANLAGTTSENHSRKVQSLNFKGTGLIDDLVLTASAPTYQDDPLGMYWIRSVLLGEGGNRDPAEDLQVASGSANDVTYTADQWYEIKSFEHNGNLLTTLTGATAYTAEYVNASYNISNHVVFGVIMTNGAPATWYGPIWGSNPPAAGTELSLYEGWLLNQDDLDAAFALIEIGLDAEDKPFVKWESLGPANGDIWLWHTADLTTGWDYPPLTDGVTVHDSGTNTWTSATVADPNLFFFVEIVEPGTEVPTEAPVL